MSLENNQEQNLIKNNETENKTEKGADKNKQAANRRSASSAKKCTRIFKTMFSNIALVFAVILYSTLGALMFQLLEQHEELRLCEEGKGKFLKELKSYREKIILFVIYNVSNENSDLVSNFDFSFNIDKNITRKVKKASNSLNQSMSSNFYNQNDSISKYPEINKMLEEYRKKIIDIDLKTKYHGQDCNKDSKWHFFSSLLFTITLMSTVGYGFISPLTWEGRVVCICYASMGIPIFLLCLTNLSGVLGQILRFLYKKLDSVNPISIYLRKKKLKKKLERRKRSKKYSTISKNVGENDSYGIDQKNIIVIQDAQSVTRSELSSHIYFKDLEEYNLTYEFSPDEDEDDEDNEDDDDDDDNDGNYFDYDNEVPISVALFIIISYISGGAYMFQRFENWSFSQAIYFVFVTLTTMGFGDLVPGQASNDEYTNLKSLFVCLYSMLGMSVIGMCLSVMQWACKRKIYWLINTIKALIDCSKRNKNRNTANNKHRTSASYKEKERLDILNKIKMLQQYESQINGKRRKKHVLN